jgi:hypothetical protein
MLARQGTQPGWVTKPETLAVSILLCSKLQPFGFKLNELEWQAA